MTSWWRRLSQNCLTKRLNYITFDTWDCTTLASEINSRRGHVVYLKLFLLTLLIQYKLITCFCLYFLSLVSIDSLPTLQIMTTVFSTPGPVKQVENHRLVLVAWVSFMLMHAKRYPTNDTSNGRGKKNYPPIKCIRFAITFL